MSVRDFGGILGFATSLAILMELKAATVTQAAGSKLSQETTDRKRGRAVGRMGSASVQH
jgi:hypothetical protein